MVLNETVMSFSPLSLHLDSTGMGISLHLKLPNWDVVTAVRPLKVSPSASRQILGPKHSWTHVDDFPYRLKLPGIAHLSVSGSIYRRHLTSLLL